MAEQLTRSDIFRRVSERMRAEFQELRNVPHKGLRGQEGEDVVRQFLERHLPGRFGVGSGFILDAADTVSPQIDVIVYDAYNCAKLRVSDSASVFPITNAAAVVSVRSRLNRDSIKDAWMMSEKVKSMSRSEGLVTRNVATGQPAEAALKGDAWETTVPLCILFCFESDISLDKASEHYLRQFKELGVGHHLDLIVVLDQGVVSLASWRKDVPLGLCVLRGFGGAQAEGMHVLSAVAPLGSSTLDGFIRLLLSHLICFKPVVDHPGFGWSEMESKGRLDVRYIFSVSNEDPDTESGRLAEAAHFEKFEALRKSQLERIPSESA